MAERARNQLLSLLQSRLKDAMQNKISCSDGWKRLYLMRRRLLLCQLRAKRFEPLPASLVARKLVNRHTKQVQRLIPRGKSMETSCLLKETTDYIVALKTQGIYLEFYLRRMHSNCHSLLATSATACWSSIQENMSVGILLTSLQKCFHSYINGIWRSFLQSVCFPV